MCHVVIVMSVLIREASVWTVYPTPLPPFWRSTFLDGFAEEKENGLQSLCQEKTMTEKDEEGILDLFLLEILGRESGLDDGSILQATS